MNVIYDESYIRDRRPGILCVDDEESCHILWKEELEEEGYIVHSAMNGKEALEIFYLAMHLGKPQIDLVILDINMPGMDGIEVLRQIKQKKPNMPVILCSAYPEYKRSMASWECDDYIVKSFSLDELKESVIRYLFYSGVLEKDANFSEKFINRENRLRRAILAVGEDILTLESRCPFIIACAYREYEWERIFQRYDKYIVKSFSLDELKESVRGPVPNTRLLEKYTYFSIKKINRKNQFRRAILAIGEDILTGDSGAPFVGIKYDIKTRNMGIYFGGLDLDNLAEQTHVVEEPGELYLLGQPRHQNPVRRFYVEGKEGTGTACVSFLDDVPDEVKHEWTTNIAYRLYKKRERVPGDDQQNWHKAKRLIEEATNPFI